MVRALLGQLFKNTVPIFQSAAPNANRINPVIESYIKKLASQFSHNDLQGGQFGMGVGVLSKKTRDACFCELYKQYNSLEIIVPQLALCIQLYARPMSILAILPTQRKGPLLSRNHVWHLIFSCKNYF